MREIIVGRNAVDGRLVAAGEGRPVHSPSNGRTIGRVPESSPADVGDAVAAGVRANRGWSRTPVGERADALYRFAAAIEAERESIIDLEVLDAGMVRTEVERDIRRAVDTIRFFAGLGFELKGQTIPSTADGLHLTLREPYGVVGRIVPFNHPFMFSSVRLAAPLLAGNTVVLKPSELAPLTAATILAEIVTRAFPQGVVNIVHGGATAGRALVRHPAVKRLAFTGSRDTGLAIQRDAAEVGVKAVTLELGGKNALVAFSDADPERVAAAAVRGMNFGWQGQSCGSTSRLLLHADIADTVLDLLTDHLRGLRVGNPADSSSDMGPMISEEARDRVLKFAALGGDDGSIRVGGGVPDVDQRLQGGYWVEPTLVTDVPSDSRLFRDEIFGPVVVTQTFHEVSEAIELANGVPYGLTASIWTSDVDLAITTARDLRVGYVWINDVATHFRNVPFGGQKESGIGRENAMDELYSYTETKAINVTVSRR